MSGRSESRYRAALVGLGRIASLLEDDRLREKPATHAGALHANPRTTIVGGCDIDRERRNRFAGRWNVLTVTETIQELLERESPDILVIATHPDSHEYYLRQAVGFGVPVVTCEKPLAHTIRAARRMKRLVQRNVATRVIVNHERRYSRDYRLVRDAVEHKRFGDLLSVTGTLHFSRTQRLDRTFLHDGTHLIDAINFLSCGSVRLRHRSASLKSTASTVFLEGSIAPAGIPVSIHVGTGRDYLQFLVDLSFSEGRIQIGNGIFQWEISRQSPFYDTYRSLVNMERRRPEPSEYFSAMVADAVGLLDYPHRQPVSSIDDAYEVMKTVGGLLIRL